MKDAEDAVKKDVRKFKMGSFDFMFRSLSSGSYFGSNSHPKFLR